MRLDKYLKVSRLIKRRTVANEACDNERVTVNGGGDRERRQGGRRRHVPRDIEPVFTGGECWVGEGFYRGRVVKDPARRRSTPANTGSQS